MLKYCKRDDIQKKYRTFAPLLTKGINLLIF